jgi:DNA-binding response OmpR family regulator
MTIVRDALGNVLRHPSGARDDTLDEPSVQAERSEGDSSQSGVNRLDLRPSVLVGGPFRVDLIGSRMWVNGVELLEVKPLHVRFLSYLLERRGQLCTREQIRAIVFAGRAMAPGNCARVVAELRRECGSAGRLIRTVRGEGYRLELPSYGAMSGGGP